MADEVDSKDSKEVKTSTEESSDDKPQTKLSRFVSKSKEDLSTFSSKTYSKLEPIILPLKNKYVRYTLSAILFGLVVTLYVLYETYPEAENKALRATLVPIGLVLATILVFYITWDDPFFKKYRSPGIYVVVLTTIFYIFIFTDISELLFSTTLAKWLTRSTGVITSSIVMAFGVNLLDVSWVPFYTYTQLAGVNRTTFFLSSPFELRNLIDTKWMIRIIFSNAPSGQGSLYVDAACSGIHSLTVFAAVFLLMLFEARKRLQWNYKTILVTLLGIIGTYIMNLIRIMIIISLYYYQGGSIAGPVHNYLGYVILIIWLPIFWMYILPLAETKEVKQERKQRKIAKKEERKKKKSSQNIDES
ncbi:MAG: exosortase/archaeosortase family protein [Candidatus Heimdallarchaeota archaeon]|nr:exosortase/archaeosortase family protein [Candidatus Heimdallarchaeota archaeon]